MQGRRLLCPGGEGMGGIRPGSDGCPRGRTSWRGGGKQQRCRGVVHGRSRLPSALSPMRETLVDSRRFAPVRETLADPALNAARSATWAVVAAVGVSLLAFAFLRYRILAGGGAPATTDTGNWLAMGKDMLGPALRPASVYPPLVPLIVLAGVQVLGLVAG